MTSAPGLSLHEDNKRLPVFRWTISLPLVSRPFSILYLTHSSRWHSILPTQSQSPQPENPIPVLDLTRNYPEGVIIPSPITGEITLSDVVVARYFAIMVVNSGIVIVLQFMINCVDNCNFRDATAQAPDDAKVEALRHAFSLIGAKSPGM